MAAIIEDSDDAIISGSFVGRVTSWNPAAERLYGYTAKEIVGKSEEFLTPEDQTGEIKAVLAKIKVGKHIEHLETKRVRRTARCSRSRSPFHRSGMLTAQSSAHP